MEKADEQEGVPNTTTGAAPPAADGTKKKKKLVNAAAMKDVRAIMAAYDTDGDGKLDADEMLRAVEDYKKGQGSAVKALKRYDDDSDGSLDSKELEALHEDIDTSETMLKYLAFAGSLSQLGKVARAVNAGASVNNSDMMVVMRQKAIWCSWRITYSYALIDTAWMGWCHWDESPMLATQWVLSRGLFHTAMISGSFHIVRVSSAYTAKYVRGWVVPAMVATGAVVALPSVVAKPLKFGLKTVFGVA